MPGVQFGQQIDMNGNAITELAAGVDPTDAVNVSQLTAVSPQGFAVTIGDGVATSFPIAHGLGTEDIITVVYDTATGADILVEVVRTDPNTVTVTFGTAPAAGAYRVLVIPVP
jgi:hypothetical protein